MTHGQEVRVVRLSVSLENLLRDWTYVYIYTQRDCSIGLWSPVDRFVSGIMRCACTDVLWSQVGARAATAATFMLIVGITCVVFVYIYRRGILEKLSCGFRDRKILGVLCMGEQMFVWTCVDFLKSCLLGFRYADIV